MTGGLWVESATGTLLLALDFNYALAALYPDRFTAELNVDRRAQLEAIALRTAAEVQGFQLLALADIGEFNADVESQETLTALFADRSYPAPSEAWAWEPGDRLPLILTISAVGARHRTDPTDAGCDRCRLRIGTAADPVHVRARRPPLRVPVTVVRVPVSGTLGRP